MKILVQYIRGAFGINEKAYVTKPYEDISLSSLENDNLSNL